MKKRKLLMGALFCSIGIMGSTTVYAKNLTIDGISFEIPDEWQEVQNETKEDGSAYIKYRFAGGEPYYYTVPYADDTTIVDDTMFDAGISADKASAARRVAARNASAASESSVSEIGRAHV